LVPLLLCASARGSSALHGNLQNRHGVVAEDIEFLLFNPPAF
jgi:hypothetical protein